MSNEAFFPQLDYKEQSKQEIWQNDRYVSDEQLLQVI